MKSSKILFVLVGAAVAIGAFVEHCDAQGRGGRGGRGLGVRGSGQQQVSEMDLLQMKEVLTHLQEDFGLDDETKDKIKEVSDELSQQMEDKRQSIIGDFREMGQEERRLAMEEMQKITKELDAESFKEVKPMLDRKQLRRLGELKMQRMGSAALQDSLVQEMLGFTREQIDKLAEQRKSFDEKRQKFMENIREQMRGGDRESLRDRMAEMRESMVEMRENMEQALGDVLSDEQKQKLEEMKGKAFEFPERRGRRDL